jgi:hypothetical protein
MHAQVQSAGGRNRAHFQSQCGVGVSGRGHRRGTLNTTSFEHVCIVRHSKPSHPAHVQKCLSSSVIEASDPAPLLECLPRKPQLPPRAAAALCYLTPWGLFVQGSVDSAKIPPRCTAGQPWTHDRALPLLSVLSIAHQRVPASSPLHAFTSLCRQLLQTTPDPSRYPTTDAPPAAEKQNPGVGLSPTFPGLDDSQLDAHNERQRRWSLSMVERRTVRPHGRCRRPGLREPYRLRPPRP